LRDLLRSLLHWTTRNFLSFLLIVAVLIAVTLARDELGDYRVAATELATLNSGRQEIEGHLRAIEKDISERAAKLGKAPLHELNARIAALDRIIAQKSSEQQSGFAVFSERPIGKGFVEFLKRDAEIKLRRQEREYLETLRLSMETLENGPARLERLRKVHVVAYDKLVRNEAERTRLAREHPVAVRLFGLPAYRERKGLEEDYESLRDDNRIAFENVERQRRILETVKGTKHQFEVRRDQTDASLQPLYSAIHDRQQRNLTRWSGKAFAMVIDAAPTAALILLSIILVPVGVKVVFYFVLAPLASRRPPICLLPESTGMIAGVPGSAAAGPGDTSISGLSQRVEIDEGQELLIHPEYLQSSSAGGKNDTKYLLDWSYPFSSLASGMVLLTRIRADTLQSIVVSATRDPLSEVGILCLPQGSAVVLQPRSLVGVVSRNGTPIRITRHWRLGSLHAWLTLQLRYLVFHGPAKLIVKGCRGIRVEAAGSGRRINQAATIGFSANARYSTTRCETFTSYLFGKQELFNDSFTAEPGFYVYEEVPHPGSKSGITGRGMEGFTDSVLKAFGI
jgi:hypothetical protein